jgi:hypothetical protein
MGSELDLHTTSSLARVKSQEKVRDAEDEAGRAELQKKLQDAWQATQKRVIFY